MSDETAYVAVIVFLTTAESKGGLGFAKFEEMLVLREQDIDYSGPLAPATLQRCIVGRLVKLLAMEQHAVTEALKFKMTIEKTSATASAHGPSAHTAMTSLTSNTQACEQEHAMVMGTMEYDDAAVHVAKLMGSAAAVDVSARLTKESLSGMENHFLRKANLPSTLGRHGSCQE